MGATFLGSGNGCDVSNLPSCSLRDYAEQGQCQETARGFLDFPSSTANQTPLETQQDTVVWE